MDDIFIEKRYVEKTINDQIQEAAEYINELENQIKKLTEIIKIYKKKCIPTRCCECGYLEWWHGLGEYVCMHSGENQEAVIAEPTLISPDWCPIDTYNKINGV